MTDLSDFRRIVYQPETKALRRRIAELEDELKREQQAHARAVQAGVDALATECPKCGAKK